MANSGPVLVFDFVVVDRKVRRCLAKDECVLHSPLVVPVDPAVWTSRYVKHAVFVLRFQRHESRNQEYFIIFL